MTLPIEVRARLAHELLLSLEAETAEESVEKAWSQATESGAQKALSGKFESRDWETSLTSIQSRLAAG